METPLSIIAVFTAPELGFTGNTAAVLFTEKSLAEKEMRRLASDLNQPATTFLWPGEEQNTFYVRWFAPDAEIGLCGHGSLAAIAYLHNHHKTDSLKLRYNAGEITGTANNDGTCSMQLNAIDVTGQAEPSPILEAGLGIPVKEYFTTNNKQIVVVGSEKELEEMKPDFEKLRQSDVFGYSVTAPGETADFVSRTLVPHVQQLEDHATGSSHAALAPFWSKRLGKSKMTALQLSKRGGKFECEVKGKQVTLSGYYTLIAEGQLFI